MLNLGVVAHVDAGKTSLTERLLFDAGAIARLGSVDGGDTTTDGMALERRRGITIRAAVACLRVGDHQVHLIDTPGHVDFVAEVERALGVLDGAVLVISAVEGVQAHTRVLMRTLRAVGVPTLLFVNKVDRAGARGLELLAELRRLLDSTVIALNRPADPGTRAASVVTVPLGEDAAEVLAERSDAVLESYVDGLDPELLRAELIAQTRKGHVFPVLFGSAITGVGTAELFRAIVELLPCGNPTAAGNPLAGTVFAVERDAAGRRFAVARLFSGTVAARDRVEYLRHRANGVVSESGRVTTVLDATGAPGRVGAGGIARIGGLPRLRVGDHLGTSATARPRAFRLPTMETVVTSADPAALFAALDTLSDEDPFIDVRRGPEPGSLVVSLYGEVQREVIADRLADEFGVTARFAPTRAVCVERVVGSGHAVHHIGDGLPFCATLGLRVDPGSGVDFRLAVERGSLPGAFFTSIEESVRAALDDGPHGWRVVDCRITVTHTGYFSPVTTAGDFRGLAPLLLADALRSAGTAVCEPVDRVELVVPSDALTPVLAAVVRLGGLPEPPRGDADTVFVSTTLATARVRELAKTLPGLTNGVGSLTTHPLGHRSVSRDAPGPAPRPRA